MQWGRAVDKSLHSAVGWIFCKAYIYTVPCQWGRSVDVKLTQCSGVELLTKVYTVRWDGSFVKLIFTQCSASGVDLLT